MLFLVWVLGAIFKWSLLFWTYIQQIMNFTWNFYLQKSSDIPSSQHQLSVIARTKSVTLQRNRIKPHILGLYYILFQNIYTVICLLGLLLHIHIHNVHILRYMSVWESSYVYMYVFFADCGFLQTTSECQLFTCV